MISGSVAVEGGAPRAFPGGAEFLRPLARAPPYGRAPPRPPVEGEAPSAAPAYPPVPGAYARFVPHFYPYGAAYHHLSQAQQAHQAHQVHQVHQLQRETQALRDSQALRDAQVLRESHQLQRETQVLRDSQSQSMGHHNHSHSQHPLHSPREAAVVGTAGSPLHQPIAPPPPPLPPPSPPSRPAPRGKEGSLKHRLLSRERSGPVGRFTRGALIQLGGGQLRRVEDMRTEDFVLSAERSPELRLADSTVVRLLRRPATDTVTLTLSYNRNRAQVDMESPVEHPFFVYGQGWASCSPERTLQCYGLQVNRLQVGDVCVSLIPREPSSPCPCPSPSSAATAPTCVTTATTTAMTVRPTEAPQRYPENLSIREIADSRKRRSSAPDMCPDENSVQRPRKMMMRH